ncbi:hypothetical protein FA95DRAFT_1611046 [Auriscalpium vulgare]|uniref:Uncharacterized protein n=1 Tax=Auriscalpium vulgare TaxID=40419 RepID=A0ACB8RBI0_9AGAM|nr:hypothetical protein FA95DRAFT_1611046 [Auriscalpium vulgare]
MRHSIFATFLLHVVIAFANTEIVNFSASLIHAPALDFLNWTTIRLGENELRFENAPAPLYTPLERVCEQVGPHNCPHELWLVLDLNHVEWASYTKFTLRVSWPASHPADFDIQILTAQDVLRVFSALNRHQSQAELASTRRQYARIRLVDTGVRPPSAVASPSPVPFIIIVEPLYLNVLPASVLPVVLFLLPLIGAAAMLVPVANRFLGEVATHATAELKTVH